MSKWKNQKTEELIGAFLKLKSKKNAENFLRDLLTEQEIIEFGNRWKAARMLSQDITYPKIQKVTGLSTRTIARISKWLKTGTGGYKMMLKRINHHRTSSRSGKRLI